MLRRENKNKSIYSNTYINVDKLRKKHTSIAIELNSQSLYPKVEKYY